MKANAVNRIAELGAAEVKPELRRFEIAGEQYVIGSAQRLDPEAKRPQPTVTPIALHTLRGLVGYLTAKVDPLSGLIHVESPTRVSVIGPVFGHMKQRETFVTSEIVEDKHPFGQDQELENFAVWMRSRFVPTKDSEELLRVLSSVKDGAVKTAVDDGFSQEVSVKVGASLTETARPKNPVMLQPYRTFREVAQPMSEFVVRLKSNPGGLPRVAVYESDGGAWRLEAVAKIVEYLKKELTGWVVIG